MPAPAETSESVPWGGGETLRHGSDLGKVEKEVRVFSAQTDA